MPLNKYQTITVKRFEAASITRRDNPPGARDCVDDPREPRSAYANVSLVYHILYLKAVSPVSNTGFTTRPIPHTKLSYFQTNFESAVQNMTNKKTFTGTLFLRAYAISRQ